jgi:hypothetical protein
MLLEPGMQCCPVRGRGTACPVCLAIQSLQQKAAQSNSPNPPLPTGGVAEPLGPRWHKEHQCTLYCPPTGLVTARSRPSQALHTASVLGIVAWSSHLKSARPPHQPPQRAGWARLADLAHTDTHKQIHKDRVNRFDPWAEALKHQLRMHA